MELPNNKITGERYEQREPLWEQLRLNVEKRNIYQSYANARSVFRGFFIYGFNLHITLLSLRRDSPHLSSLAFSIRPRSLVGRATVDLIWRSWVPFPPGSENFICASCSSLIPFNRVNPPPSVKECLCNIARQLLLV